MYDRLKNNQTARIVAAIVAFVVVTGVLRDVWWGKTIGSALLIDVFTFGLPAASLVAAFWIGVQAAQRSKSTIVGWIVGILAAVLLTLASRLVEKSLGIDGWLAGVRAEQDRCYTDWDGRSNPTVCE